MDNFNLQKFCLDISNSYNSCLKGRAKDSDIGIDDLIYDFARKIRKLLDSEITLLEIRETATRAYVKEHYESES